MPAKPKPQQALARRTPSQTRARQTRLLIFEAALRVLEQDGLAGFNTNRIAEVAGYSIGTLYQYFRDKHALLDALTQHEQQRLAAEITRLLQPQRLASEAPGARIHALLSIVHKVFGGRRRARRLVLEWALRFKPAADSLPPLVKLAEQLVAGLMPTQGRPRFTPAEAFVLTHAVAGAIRSAILRDGRRLADPQFESALVDLVVGFTRQRQRH